MFLIYYRNSSCFLCYNRPLYHTLGAFSKPCSWNAIREGVYDGQNCDIVGWCGIA